MLSYMIVVSDAGSLESVSEQDIMKHSAALSEAVFDALNDILDARAIAAGEYDPEQNDVPIKVV